MAAAMVMSEYYLATKEKWVIKELEEVYAFLTYSQYMQLSQVNEKVKETHPDAYPRDAMDSHGGWLGSVVDLAKFACAFDDPEECKILKTESITTMFARPPGLAGHEADGKPKDVYYSCGWLNRVVGDGKMNRWHTGSLPGTAAILVRRHDGRNWVVMFNARVSPYASHLGRAIDVVVHKAASEVEEWPEYDLFDSFQ